MQPLAAVRDVEDGVRLPAESSVELQAQVLAELLAPVRRRHVCRRVEVPVGLVVLRLRGDEHGARLDFPRLGPTIPALGSLQASLPQRDARSVGHDADDARLFVVGVPIPVSAPLDERGRLVAPHSDDFADRVRRDLEGVAPGEGLRGVPVRMADGVARHLVCRGGGVAPDQPQPVVERIVAGAPVLAPVVRPPDPGELSEERDDALAVVPGVALVRLGLVVPRCGGACREELGHELAAQPVHVVEERLLELRGAGDSVALYGARGGVDDGVDLRGASQDELRELFFRGDSDDAISFASASESSKTRSLSFLPAETAALNSETLSTGMENEWFFPPRVYWRLW